MEFEQSLNQSYGLMSEGGGMEAAWRTITIMTIV